MAAAVLIQEGVLSPFPDNTLRPGAPLTRAEAVTLLARAAEKAGLPGLVTADFAGASAGQLTVVRGETPESYPLDVSARFFRSLDGSPAAASELTLTVGDKVELRPGERGGVVPGGGADPQGSGRRPQLPLLPLGGAPDPRRHREVGDALRERGEGEGRGAATLGRVRARGRALRAGQRRARSC